MISLFFVKLTRGSPIKGITRKMENKKQQVYYFVDLIRILSVALKFLLDSVELVEILMSC